MNTQHSFLHSLLVRINSKSWISWITPDIKSYLYIFWHIIKKIQIWEIIWNFKFKISTCNATLKSKESPLSAKPTPMKALLPWFWILRTKYREESLTDSISFVGYSEIGASAKSCPLFLSSSYKFILLYTILQAFYTVYICGYNTGHEIAVRSCNNKFGSYNFKRGPKKWGCLNTHLGLKKGELL